MFSINYRDARPIYQQLKDNLRRLIVTGSIPSGEKLPSVRELAAELAINPNTIQRAYRELESEGYVVSIAGRGSFAAEGKAADPGLLAESTEAFLKQAHRLRELGIELSQLHAILDDDEQRRKNA